MIDVFDKNLKKINTIRKYTLAQYVDKFREIGTFKILAQFVDENLYLLSDEQFYILFDGRVFGRVDKVLRIAIVNTIKLSKSLDSLHLSSLRSA